MQAGRQAGKAGKAGACVWAGRWPVSACHLVLRGVQIDEQEFCLLVRPAGCLAPPALLPAWPHVTIPLCIAEAGW